MDTCLSLVLGTVLLLGCLQAQHVPTANFKLLIKNMKCASTLNFTSPTNVKVHCHDEALKIIKAELKHSQKMCPSNLANHRVDQVLKALDRIPTSPSNNSTDCKWENEGSQKPFKEFVENIKILVQKLNSQSAH